MLIYRQWDHWEQNCCEVSTKLLTFSFSRMPMKMSLAKRWPFCLHLNVLKTDSMTFPCHDVGMWIFKPHEVSSPTKWQFLYNATSESPFLIARFIRWAPCWPHEHCYLGLLRIVRTTNALVRHYRDSLASRLSAQPLVQAQINQSSAPLAKTSNTGCVYIW